MPVKSIWHTVMPFDNDGIPCKADAETLPQSIRCPMVQSHCYWWKGGQWSNTDSQYLTACSLCAVHLLYYCVA